MQLFQQPQDRVDRIEVLCSPELVGNPAGSHAANDRGEVTLVFVLDFSVHTCLLASLTLPRHTSLSASRPKCSCSSRRNSSKSSVLM